MKQRLENLYVNITEINDLTQVLYKYLERCVIADEVPYEFRPAGKILLEKMNKIKKELKSFYNLYE